MLVLVQIYDVFTMFYFFGSIGRVAGFPTKKPVSISSIRIKYIFFDSIFL